MPMYASGKATKLMYASKSCAHCLACASMLCMDGVTGAAEGNWGMESSDLHDGDLLAAPRKVERVAIRYAQSSKQAGRTPVGCYMLDVRIGVPCP